MGTIHLPQDFKEFFQSFNQHEVEYAIGIRKAAHPFPYLFGLNDRKFQKIELCHRKRGA